MKKVLLILLPLFFCFAENEISVNLSTDNHLTPIKIKEIENKDFFYPQSYLNDLQEVLYFDFNQNGRSYISKSNDCLYEIKLIASGKNLKVSFINHISNSINRYQDILISGKLSKDRQKIHQISDDIFFKIFKKHGIASTKILFTERRKIHGEWVSELCLCDYDGHNVIQLTDDNQYNVTPCFLPKVNGNTFETFLYVSFKKGQPKIFKGSINDPNGEPLFSLPGNQLLPCVSSNCRMIAFISDAAGRTDLFLQHYNSVGKAEGKPIQLFSYPRAIQATSTFSPNNKKIAFVSDKDGPPRIYLMDLPSKYYNKRQNVKLITKQNRHNTSPNWSPDGKKIAYSAKVNGIGQIWVYDIESDKEWQLTSDVFNKENPKWAPDSFHLIYNTEDGNHSELYIINLNNKDPLQISKGAGQKRFPCWEPGKTKRTP
ncbi:MAG: Tol-Pal system protein TolB [Chlamydiota bacterium]|jgi:TolB protein